MRSLRTFLFAAAFGIAAHAAGPVRYHSGDDLRWASPYFNDSSWPVSPDGKVSRSTSPDLMLWERRSIQIPKDISGPMAVLWPANCGLVGAPAELFLNGVRVASIGHFGPHADAPLEPPICVYPIERGLVSPGETVIVAVRVCRISTLLWRITRERVSGVSFGRQDVLEERARRERAESLLTTTVQLAICAFIVIAGFTMLVLHRIFRGESLVRNFGLLLVAYGCMFALRAGRVPLLQVSSITGEIMLGGITALFLVILLEVLWTRRSRRGIRLLRAGQVLVAAPLLPGLGDVLFHLSPPLVALYELLQDLAWIAVALTSADGLRRAGGTRLIASGGLIFALLNLVAPRLHPGGWAFSVGPLTLGAYFSASFVIVIGIGAVLATRLVLDWKERQRLQADIQAARQVQSALMPEHPPRVPGFDIEAAYLPANEVGGDFYQVLQPDESSSIILVGDVSGKGLKAAMVASLAAGAARAAAKHTSRPGEILANMNQAIAGELEGGFVTCCCMRLSIDGKWTFANAGHVFPYVAGQPLTTASGIPLGILPDAVWEEAAGQMHAGETLVFVSDGVVEARGARGELYGFERVEADLARFQTPADLAKKAQQFGQEDDITVLCVRRGEAVLHAV